DVAIVTANYQDDLTAFLASDTNRYTAAYLLPYLGEDEELVAQTLTQLNEYQIPTTSLFGGDYIREGALVGYKTSDNIRKIPRRIALNVMKIVEGQNAKDLPVGMETFDDNLIINMETARRINIYPDFDLMSEATLYNLEVIPTDNTLTLQSAIAQALANNLDIKIDQANVDISNTEIDIAKSEMLPSLDVSTSYSVQDEVSTLSKQGALGRSNFLATGELSQIILAEPVLANIAIQKMLKYNQEESLRQTQMDIVIDVAQTYMNILFAKSNLNIQQENVARTRENYAISKAKESIGYTGSSDINRWEAELANANSELNSAYASLRQAKFLLNQLLNRPIDDVIEIADVSLESSMLLITDARTDLIDNYGKLEVFADFLVAFAKENLPELAQINIATDVEKRLQLSRKRALYLPNIAASASASRILGRYDVPTGLNPIDISTTWNIGLGLSYPIFQGNYRKKLIEQSNISLTQLKDSKKDLENRLELRIRSQLESVGAAYSKMDLSNTAAVASNKNFAIVQDAYSAGQSNVTTLIDAQNNALFSKLSATNAVYSFILEFLTLERSIGFYNFLATEQEKKTFFQDVRNYLFAQ
ncbi:MAG: TolC family protein, partial [Bacteroidia bacterium]|nr:TolC family protein [Bacteroidia bacterium]